ncbi:MAG: WYL domain-containing protein [archaeon]|nr:WYL domain-containing protein [archaeon]
MVYLAKKDADKIIKELSNTQNKAIRNIIKKIKTTPEKRVYVKGESEIQRLLQRAFKEKRKIKIRYYSPHSDENTIRIIELYQVNITSIIAYCHLREEERTFAIKRINSVALLDEKYNLPKNWTSESIILDR